MASQEEQVAALKDQGNKLYQAGEWLKSAATYSSALKLDPGNAVLYSNRSAALLKLKKVQKALEDADKAIELRPEWEKGYFRKGGVLEEQGKHEEALVAYQTGIELSPDNRELQQKVRTLAKLLNKQVQLTQKKEQAAAKPQQQKQQQPPQQKESAPATGASTGAPAAGSPSADGVEYEDLGSEEVASFCEEYLQLLAEEVRQHGVDWIPMVHMLPGPGSEGTTEEVQPNIRGAGAWESPQTLDGFVSFCRACAEKLDAQAVMALVPKPAIAFPQTWTKPKWPGGTGPGVFAQLESRQVRKCWFIPVEGVGSNKPMPGTPISVSADTFGPMARVLKGGSA